MSTLMVLGWVLAYIYDLDSRQTFLLKHDVYSHKKDDNVSNTLKCWNLEFYLVQNNKTIDVIFAQSIGK